MCIHESGLEYPATPDAKIQCSLSFVIDLREFIADFNDYYHRHVDERKLLAYRSQR